MAAPLNRRRFIGISAASAGLALLPFGRAAMAEAHPVTWNGQALGAQATLVVHHHDRSAAERLVERAVAEVARLERIFSLYRADSALVELNRVGALAAPPADLVELLETSQQVWAATDGAFDPTVQPLWMLYARHFSAAGADPAGPSHEQHREVLVRVGFDKVKFSRDRVSLSRPGMALTFNGIAQGYITDRVVDLLRDGGIASSLVDMGEIRTLGVKPDKAPWTVAVDGTPMGDDLSATLEVVDKAVATSSIEGFHFDAAGRFNHLLDPRSGATAGQWKSMTVIAPDAAAADALSTAFNLMDADAITAVVRASGGIEVLAAGREQSLRF